MKHHLIDYWESTRIIKDKKVIDAFDSVPREMFILDDYSDEAYGDYPLPIGHNQTISQPTTIMIMTQALELKYGQKVLEVGAGSGYQAAIIAKIIGEKGKVFTTEIIPELVEFARNNLKKCNIDNVEVIKADGSSGYKKQGPYDRIIVTAACPKIPDQLIEQLKENGIIIAPVGPLYGQSMIKAIKKKGRLETVNLGFFIFVPLNGKHGY